MKYEKQRYFVKKGYVKLKLTKILNFMSLIGNIFKNNVKSFMKEKSLMILKKKLLTLVKF
jgi:hypothetical protein